MEKTLRVLTDPVSNRILQLIRIRKKMTISDILAENKELPRATVYRKVEKMLDVGAIYIAESHKVRGQTENVYAIKEMYITAHDSNEENLKMVTISLMQILDQYDNYFRSGKADANKDKLFLLNYAIPLSDKEFSAMTNEIFRIVDKYQKKTSPDARLRSLYFLSAPGGKYHE